MFLLALDQGTTSSRAIVFDSTGQPVATAQREHRQIYPEPGWVEHDPEEIWENQSAVAIEALAAAKLTARDISAVGITNQRETTLVWDRRTGQPIGNAIVWQDRRTAGDCAALRAAGHGPLFTGRTGLRLDPYFSGTKLAWLLQHRPELRQRAEHGEVLFGTIDSWLIWKLTGGKVHATDATNASRTLLLNLLTTTWDEDCLAALNVPAAMLPQVVDSSGIIAETAAPRELAGIPIAGIAGDQQAALFGQACFQPGMAKNTYGTGCFLLMHTGDQAMISHTGLVSTVAWRIGGRTEYALEGSVFVAGAVVQWLRDEMQIIHSAPECDELAATVPDSHGLFLVPAFVGLGAPHWDPYARGAAFGITRGTNRAHFCRAALESIALQSEDLLRCMEKDSGIPLAELRVDGGATRSDLLLQIQSDLLDRPVVRPRCIETTALGAAYLAGLATGVWRDRAEIAAQWSAGSRFSPQGNRYERLRAGWIRAVERSKAWAES
ncbi:MAG TPA: glycerol kinase GlpK [Chthoniobacter sp.]|jgi:glycerol kinase